MIGYDLLADLMVAIHSAYVAFVLIGQIAILIGARLKWSWVRNFWFRITHLVAIAIVGFEAVFEIECPLTAWESRFRVLAGHDASEGSFIGRWLHYLLSYDVEPWILNAIHIGFALVVLATLLLLPPRWPRRRPGKQSPSTLPGSHASAAAATRQR
jgi:hypothetical protein